MKTKQKHADEIPFEVFASFRRLNEGKPILTLEPPQWAAATHAIVKDDTQRIGATKDRGLVMLEHSGLRARLREQIRAGEFPILVTPLR